MTELLETKMTAVVIMIGIVGVGIMIELVVIVWTLDRILKELRSKR